MYTINSGEVFQFSDCHDPEADDGIFLVQIYVFGKIFVKIRSVVLLEVANKQTNKQTKQTPGKHDLLGGGSNSSS